MDLTIDTSKVREKGGEQKRASQSREERRRGRGKRERDKEGEGEKRARARARVRWLSAAAASGRERGEEWRREEERKREGGKEADEGALVDHEATTNGAHIASCEHGPEGAREATAQSLVLLGGTRGVRRRTHVHGAWRGARSSKQLVCDSCGESASRVIVIFLLNQRDTTARNELYRRRIDRSPCVSRTRPHTWNFSAV